MDTVTRLILSVLVCTMAVVLVVPLGQAVAAGKAPPRSVGVVDFDISCGLTCAFTIAKQ